MRSCGKPLRQLFESPIICYSQNFRLYKPPNILAHLTKYQQTFEIFDLRTKQIFTLQIKCSLQNFLLQTELKKGLEILNIKFSENILDLMFKEADKDSDGKISYTGNSRF